MLYADGLLGIALLVLWVYALLDVITSDEAQIRNLPKWGWFVVVLLLGELAIGPVLWLVAGRPRGARPPLLPTRDARPVGSPDDDEAFLRGLRARAEEQRRKAERDRRTEGDPPA